MCDRNNHRPGARDLLRFFSMIRARAVLSVALLAGCAASRKSAVVSHHQDRPSLPYRKRCHRMRGDTAPARPGDVEMKEVSEKAWLAATRQNLASD